MYTKAIVTQARHTRLYRVAFYTQAGTYNTRHLADVEAQASNVSEAADIAESTLLAEYAASNLPTPSYTIRFVERV